MTVHSSGTMLITSIQLRILNENVSGGSNCHTKFWMQEKICIYIEQNPWIHDTLFRPNKCTCSGPIFKKLNPQSKVKFNNSRGESTTVKIYFKGIPSTTNTFGDFSFGEDLPLSTEHFSLTFKVTSQRVQPKRSSTRIRCFNRS